MDGPSHLSVANVVIRQATREDVAAIARLLGQLGYLASDVQVERRLERLARSNADVLLVAEESGEVIGLASLHVSLALEYDGDAGKLSAIVVDERQRGRGIARELVGAIEREARRRGCLLLFLTTAERRWNAHGFYRAVGFEETGRRFAKSLR